MKKTTAETVWERRQRSLAEDRAERRSDFLNNSDLPRPLNRADRRFQGERSIPVFQTEAQAQKWLDDAERRQQRERLREIARARAEVHF